MSQATLEAKDPDVAKPYSINVRKILIEEAHRDYRFALSAFVRPQRGTGYYYQATPANSEAWGLTGQYWPTWPRVAGETVTDGSIVWTAVHPADASLPSISSVVWTVPTGITKDSQSEDIEFADIVLSGGVDGADYDLTARITMTDGTVLEYTVTVPVRAQ